MSRSNSITNCNLLYSTDVAVIIAGFKAMK